MSTETAIKPPETIAERFARETQQHELSILHDDGLYRHLRFQKPATSSYAFELITVPNALIYRGEESYVFSRLRDMFEFFRSPAGHINPGYWSEKLTSNRDAVKRYSREMFEQLVAEHLEESEEEWPGVTAAWAAAMDDTIDYDLDHEESARQALGDFEFGAKFAAVCPCGGRIEVSADDLIPADWRDQHPRGLGHPYKTDRISGFRFTDTWEWDLKDYDHWFLWACHAIAWGIRQYDKARATGASAVAPALVTVEPVGGVL